MAATRRTKRFSALTALALIAGALLWLNLGPRQLGGAVSYVITYGNSMEPKVHEGDLAIVRESDDYGAGDVIAYYSPLIERVVLHRIVDTESGAFVTKGDNNDWLDTERPKTADVIGKLWIHVPGGGKLLGWLGSPIAATACVAVMTLVLFGRGKRVDKESAGKPRVITDLRWSALNRRQHLGLIACGCAALPFLLLAVLGLAKEPVRAIVHDAAYNHTGAYSYSATVPRSLAYQGRKVSTGDPLYLKIVDEVDVAFDYELRSAAPVEVKGTADLTARLENSSGWNKTFQLAEETKFSGNSVRVEGPLDLQQMRDTVSELQGIVGVSENYSIVVSAKVEVAGTVGGQTFDETFKPDLPLGITPAQIVVGVPGSQDQTGVLRPRQEGSVQTSELATNRISLPGLSFEVSTARRIGVGGLLACALAALAIWQLLGSRKQTDEASAIALRYEEWLIDVTMIEDAPGKSVAVKDFEALVRLAEQQNRMILHEELNGRHRYRVEEDGTAFTYTIEPVEDPIPMEEIRGRFRTREERRREEVAAIRAQLEELEATLERQEGRPSNE